MVNHPMPPLFRRWLAGVLAVLIGLGPLATPAYSALTPLADEPLGVKNSAKPNIILTVDDSTSMLFDFLPDYVVSNYCRGGTGAMTSACGSVGAVSDFTAIGGGKYSSPGFIFEQYNRPYSTYTGTYDASGPGAGCWAGSPPTCSPGIDPGALPGLATFPAGPNSAWPPANQPYAYWELWPAPPHSAGLNALYYDPRLTYDPPVDSTGASYPQMDAAGTSIWTKVPGDPWASTITYVDLTTSIVDGLWCNSDWSLGSSTDPTQCRYNGEGGAAFGTVSASDGQDYTYPWAPPGFVVSASAGSTTTQAYAAQKVSLNATLTGTATTANWTNAQNAKYFYENENVIWCDPTSSSWPQTGNPIAQVCGGLTAQNCNAIAQTCNKTPGSCNGYSAAACNNIVTGTCTGWAGSLCGGGSAGACTNPPACNFGTCNNPKGQTCIGTAQSCNNINSQTCSGPLAQVCNLPGTQTCVGTITYNPPGCNLLPPDPENPCVPTVGQNCTPNPGTCSIQTSKSCTQNSDCTPQPGLCSVTLTSCMAPSDCSPEGHCSSDNKLCTQSSDCALVGGTCNRTPNKTCTKDSDCPSAGNCSNNAALFCLDATVCGQCNNPAGQACTSVAQCTQGTCNQTTCPNGTTVCNTSADCGGLACTLKTCASNANCPAFKGATCTVGGALCGQTSQCPTQAGHCSDYCKDGVTVCTKNSDCAAVGGNCGAAPGKVCNGTTQAAADATCTKNGTCNNPPNAACSANPGTCPEILGSCAKDPTVKCRGSNDCGGIGTCSFTNAACNSNVPCNNLAGTCSITGQACTTPGQDLVNCPNVGKCGPSGGPYTGQQCTSTCPSIAGPLPPSAATCSTGSVGGVASATLRNDAENNGVVCRRNNKTSGAYTSGAYTYPSGKFLTPITNGNSANAADNCPSTNHYATTPRHYWKAEVQWCDKKIATAGDKWLGYGTDAGGTCQPGKDTTHIYPRFFQFGATSYVDNYVNSAFQRVDLDISKRATANYTHTWIDSNGQTQTITRNFDQEMTNYANWFAYYRTRIQAVKTVTSLAFTALDDQYRVGFHTLSNGVNPISPLQIDPATFVNIADFDATQKAAWWAQLFGITIPLGLETPTLDAMERIGEYFLNGTATGLTGATDPIILSCQKNWHMLFTDGFTNQSKLPTTTVNDQDLTVPLTIPVNGTPTIVPGLTGGASWPHPFQEDPNAGASNAASDYAMNYWVTDLRPSGPNSADNVPATSKDPAIWQHLNFAAMSLGTQGKLPVANQSLTENLLSAGTLQWPQPYPNVYHPDNSGVDDLWHAAINGRGRFVNAGSADELKLGMGQILQDITNQAGSRAGVGLASSSISLSNHSVYRVTFQPGWGGTVTKIDIDVVTGAEVSNIWEAAQQLHNQLAIVTPDPTCAAPGSCPWFTNRKIFTTNDSNTAVPFLWANLSPAQQDSLAPGLPSVGQAIVEYLRGNPTNEGVSTGQFRVRSTASFGENFLGDIVDSQAVFVGPPSALYIDANDPGYSAFTTAQASRPARVYAGGNDGMLHAFDDATGNEAWAYIPHDLYRPDATGLGALSYQDGALPPFRHHYYVDSTPRIIDVNFGGGNSDWHSLLVGGLGKGGKSYYALDVTNSGSITTEAQAASQYLWTFTDADMGYSFGKPVLTKTRAFGGAWVMIVASGYNSPSGVGKIFFVDAKTGTKLKEMSTGFGTAANPSGLAHVAGYTQDFRNELADQVYGGDLYGNFWRFNILDSNPANWTVDLMANFTDPGGNPQPVTTPPEIAIDFNNDTDRWVFIGTGRLLDETDLTDTSISDQQQTFYAIRDGTTSTPLTITAPLAPRTDLDALSDPTKGDETLGLKQVSAKGWYDDLPAGERIITPVKAAISVVAYAGTKAQDNPCLTGQEADLFVREFALGNSLLTDASGSPITSISEAQGAAGLDIAIFSDSSGPASASQVDIRVAVSSTSTGDVAFQHVKPPSFISAHRMSWRLLGQ